MTETISSSAITAGANNKLLEHLLDDQNDSWYSYWLGYLKTQLPFEAALLLADEQGLGQLEAVGLWPDKSPLLPSLEDAVKEAIDKGGAVVAPVEDKHCVAAWPSIHDGKVIAVVALILPMANQEQLSEMLAQLEWCAGWFELRLMRRMGSLKDDLLNRQQVMLDGFNVVLEHRHFDAAALAFSNFACRELQCERVVLAYVEKGLLRVACQSDSNEYSERLNSIQLSVKAMQEAVEQLESVSWPPREDRDQVNLAHRELCEYVSQSCALSVPLIDREFCYGVLLFERTAEQAFSQEDRLRAESLSNVVALNLEQKRQAQMPLSKMLTGALRSKLESFLMPGYLARKLSFIAIVVLMLFFSFVRAEYHLAADSVLEGVEIRSVVVPYDSFLDRALVRAGDQIDEGTLVATLDTRELRLERIKWISERGQAQRQYDDALAKQDRSSVQVHYAQIERTSAELALVEFQLEQAEMRAPFNAVVVSGDQSQRIGSAVRQGDILFELAPDDRYRLALYVDEYRINDIVLGQEGQLALAALPGQNYDFRVNQITLEAELREGASVYRVEAELLSDVDALRPGLEGVAKVTIDERLLISIWTRGFRDWLSLQLWRLWG